MPYQADDLQATLAALDRLAQLYPDTFRILVLAAREELQPMGIEARLDGHSSAPVAVRWESRPSLSSMGPTFTRPPAENGEGAGRNV